MTSPTPKRKAHSGITLSICIPTYNFGAFIGETLQSLCDAIGNLLEVEVVVLDSGSVDDTSRTVETFRSRLPHLTYVRTDGPRGIDRDMAHVMSLATGTYCWLFSADDTICRHSINLVLAEIHSAQDLYLCCHANADLAMRIETPRHPVLAGYATVDFDLASDASSRDYFARALTTEALFSFLGGIVVRRERWNSVALDERFVGSCWAHVARILSLIPSGLKVRYLPDALLVKRGGNDSFATHGVVQRYRLAIAGYLQVARAFWQEDDYRFETVRRVLRNEFSLRHFLFAKWRCADAPSSEDPELLRTLFVMLHGGDSLRERFTSTIFNLAPAVTYLAVKLLRDRLRRVFLARSDSAAVQDEHSRLESR